MGEKLVLFPHMGISSLRFFVGDGLHSPGNSQPTSSGDFDFGQCSNEVPEGKGHGAEVAGHNRPSMR